MDLKRFKRFKPNPTELNPSWWFNPEEEKKDTMSHKVKEALPAASARPVSARPVSARQTKEGLPWADCCQQAFAIVGDTDDPETWKLPHHTKAIFRAIKGKIGHYRTTDWDRMQAAVAALSRAGYRGQRVQASDNEIIEAARHLATHYQKAAEPVPDTLAVLI